MPQENTTSIRDILAQEEKIQKKIDQDGTLWTKLYWGGGAHFRNWLNQARELYGNDNVQTEELDLKGLCCQLDGEKLYRIWVKQTHTSSSPPS